MKIVNVFLLLFGGLITYCHAQKVYKPGYVVTVEGDSLHGQIMNFGEKEKSAQVMFLPQGESETRYFRPADLVCYEVGGERYITAVLSVIEDYDPQITLSEPTFIPGRDTVLGFAAVLIHGEMSLYRYTTSNGRELLYASNTESQLRPLLSLAYEYYDQNAGYMGGTYSVNHEKFKAVLAELMLQCPSLYERISQL
ncbi:MAG: hypothetical protein AAFN10_17450, partial [Bacteroidota bacterium]